MRNDSLNVLNILTFRSIDGTDTSNLNPPPSLLFVTFVSLHHLVAILSFHRYRVSFLVILFDFAGVLSPSAGV